MQTSVLCNLGKKTREPHFSIENGISSSEENIARGGLSFDLSTLFEKEKTEEGKRFTL